MAKKVLNHLEKVMPDKVIPYDQFSARMVALFIEVGDYTKALDISKTMISRNDRALNYYLSGDSVRGHDRDIQIAWYEMSIIGSILTNSPIPANRYASILAPVDKWSKQFN